jgi:hypothetical protein
MAGASNLAVAISCDATWQSQSGATVFVGGVGDENAYKLCANEDFLNGEDCA